MYIYPSPSSLETSYKSSHRRRSIKKAVLKCFAIFTGKHLCWSLLVIKLQRLTPAQVFPCEYCENFKNTYFEEHLRTAASDLNNLH